MADGGMRIEKPLTVHGRGRAGRNEAGGVCINAKRPDSSKPLAASSKYFSNWGFNSQSLLALRRTRWSNPVYSSTLLCKSFRFHDQPRSFWLAGNTTALILPNPRPERKKSALRLSVPAPARRPWPGRSERAPTPAHPAPFRRTSPNGWGSPSGAATRAPTRQFAPG